MNIYKIAQTVNNGYDTFSAAIVAAPDEETARKVHPAGFMDDPKDPYFDYMWAPAKEVKVTFLGVGDVPQGVILASFHTG